MITGFTDGDVADADSGFVIIGSTNRGGGRIVIGIEKIGA